MRPFFRWLASRFSTCTAYRFELVAAGVSGDLAYTVGYEHTAASMDGTPADPYTLLKGLGQRAFYRWLDANYRSWFPGLPERTHLFRLLAAHRDWTERFLADQSLCATSPTRVSPAPLGPAVGAEGQPGLA